jgi:carbonic anhydrase
MPCICSPNTPDIPDNLKIYHAPININYKSSYISNNNHIKYDNHKFNYTFVETDNYVNSRTFPITTDTTTSAIGGGNKLYANNKVFTLQEFHFHDHQENVINGDHNCVSEIHFVFQESPTNYAVLAFIFKLSNHSSKLVRRIKHNKPFKIPSIKNYYTYSGSLTKVNPSDIPQLAVDWNVNSQYLNITQEDLEYFRTNLCRNSATVQHSNGRNVIYVQ